jgi:hypothetical protein
MERKNPLVFFKPGIRKFITWNCRSRFSLQLGWETLGCWAGKKKKISFSYRNFIKEFKKEIT